MEIISHYLGLPLTAFSLLVEYESVISVCADTGLTLEAVHEVVVRDTVGVYGGTAGQSVTTTSSSPNTSRPFFLTKLCNRILSMWYLLASAQRAPLAYAKEKRFVEGTYCIGLIYVTLRQKTYCSCDMAVAFGLN